MTDSQLIAKLQEISRRTLINDNTMAGKRATKPMCFGPLSRYAIYLVYTRTGMAQWFAVDAERTTDAGLPEVIRQEYAWRDALKGLVSDIPPIR